MQPKLLMDKILLTSWYGQEVNIPWITVFSNHFTISLVILAPQCGVANQTVWCVAFTAPHPRRLSSRQCGPRFPPHLPNLTVGFKQHLTFSPVRRGKTPEFTITWLVGGSKIPTIFTQSHRKYDSFMVHFPGSDLLVYWTTVFLLSIAMLVFRGYSNSFNAWLFVDPFLEAKLCC